MTRVIISDPCDEQPDSHIYQSRYTFLGFDKAAPKDSIGVTTKAEIKDGKLEVEFVSDEEQDRWQPLETTPFHSERVQVINCDTRDFHCGWKFEDTRENKPHLGIITKDKHRDNFFTTIDEVKKILYDLRERSGGKDKEWRFLSFKDGHKTIGGDWQFKYLRFYKTEYGWYCQPCEDLKVVRLDWLKLPLDKRLLNEH